MTEQLIPCLKPELCGVKNHHLGTYARCKAGGSGNVGGGYGPPASVRSRMSATPKPSTPLSDYVYTPTEDQPTDYDDSFYVPVTDLAIEVAGDYGIEITPVDDNEFSFEGYSEDREENAIVTVYSKRNRVSISVEFEDGSSFDGEPNDVDDRDEGIERIGGILGEYGREQE